MDTNLNCSTCAFIHLKERSEQFLLDLIDAAPEPTATAAMVFLDKARFSIASCSSLNPTAETSAEAKERLLSLKHFQRHINSSYSLEAMGVEELNEIMSRLSEDAVLLLTELWSDCGDNPCRERLHDLLELEKRQLVALLTRND